MSLFMVQGLMGCIRIAGYEPIQIRRKTAVVRAEIFRKVLDANNAVFVDDIIDPGLLDLSRTRPPPSPGRRPRRNSSHKHTNI